MNVQLQITLAQSEHLNTYIEFLEDVACWLSQRGISQWLPGTFRQSKAYYNNSIAKGETWLAYRGEELVGTLRLCLQDSIVWPEITVHNALYLYTFAVKRTWSQQGMGKELLGWAEAYADHQGKEYIRLDCMADNHFLRHYYLQAGFVNCGEVSVNYPAPVGTLHLCRFQKRLPKGVHR